MEEKNTERRSGNNNIIRSRATNECRSYVFRYIYICICIYVARNQLPGGGKRGGRLYMKKKRGCLMARQWQRWLRMPNPHSISISNFNAKPDSQRARFIYGLNRKKRLAEEARWTEPRQRRLEKMAAIGQQKNVGCLWPEWVAIKAINTPSQAIEKCRENYQTKKGA